MIRTSRLAKTLALSSAAALHGAVIWGFSKDMQIEIEGSAGAVEARIGSSFADMAAGTLSATPVEEITETVESETAADTPPPEVTQPTPERPLTSAEPPPERLTALQPEPPLPLEPMTPVAPVPTKQVETARDPAPAPTAPASPEMIQAETDQPPSVTRSLRPRTRSAELEKQAAPPKPKAQAERQQPKTQPRGNARQNATVGSETGQARSTAKAAGTGASRQQATGNAAASNYPGKVMKKIARVPKPRVGSKGTTVVAFTISAGGRLSALSLARSSGSSSLDQAALRVIRRAAPFPPPPAGARRSFSIKIKGG